MAQQKDNTTATNIVRGGGWYVKPRGCRSELCYRQDIDRKEIYIGFRVVVHKEKNNGNNNR